MMLDEFCEYLRQQGKSENTVKAYCQGMKEYMRWHEETFGKEELQAAFTLKKTEEFLAGLIASEG